MRRFGANRSNGNRAHAGCDLYANMGRAIYAVKAGIVINNTNLEFYKGTFSVAIDHGDFIARYCEVQQNTLVKYGAKVAAGQKIARVGHLVNITVPSDMLHFEMYNKSSSGDFTAFGQESRERADGVPFNRRQDLVDPTAYLSAWSARKPIAY